MKLTVKKTFRDKTDHVTVYEPGTILEVNDKERAADLVKRGLCAVYKGKAAGVTLDAAAPGVPENPEGTKTPEGAGSPDGATVPEAGGQATKQEGA